MSAGDERWWVIAESELHSALHRAVGIPGEQPAQDPDFVMLELLANARTEGVEDEPSKGINMGTKNNPGDFDCYEAAEPDEPMFVLLARDVLASDLVYEWARRREVIASIGTPDERELAKIAEARACADAMRDWHGLQHQEHAERDEFSPPSKQGTGWPQ